MPWSSLGTATAVVPLLATPLVMALPDLRVMPLGDSLTRGDKSSDSMGYRRQLRYKLLSESANVDLVGSQRSPLDTDEDNDWEGKDGADLAEINATWPKSIATQPNVVLVHAGTTNIANEEDLDGAPDMMVEIIDGLLGGAPETVVLVSPVMWANKESFWAPRDAFNEQLSGIIQGKQDEGKHVLEVPIVIGPDDLNDAFNPNDRGYENIAQFWVDAIRDADERGWLKDPPDVDAEELLDMGLGITGATEAEDEDGNGDNDSGDGSSDDNGSEDDDSNDDSSDDDNSNDDDAGDNDSNDDGAGDDSSGDDGEIFYIGPEIWEEDNPSIGCEPPCVLVLPPKHLESETTITFPVATETIEETWEETTDGNVVAITTTITTEITIPPVVTSEIQYSNIVLTKSDSEMTLSIQTSIVPPPITLTDEERGITWTYSPAPEPTETEEPPPDTDDSDNDENNDENDDDDDDDDDDNNGFGIIVVPGPPVRPPCTANCGTHCSGPACGGSGGGGGGGGSDPSPKPPKPPCIGLACPPGQGSCVGPSCSSEGNEDNEDDNDNDDDDDDKNEDEDEDEDRDEDEDEDEEEDDDDDDDDECEDGTVTDYWVSCSGTAPDACTTTSSEVITGCSLTGEATTTTHVEEGCPVITIGDFYDNFADFDGKTQDPSTTTYLSSVYLDGEIYQVNKHMQIVIGETAFAIPSATAITTAEINGNEAVIDPEHTGLIFGSGSGETTDKARPTTTIYPWPTQSEPGADASAYCYHFDTENDDWAEDLADKVIDDFCSAKEELKPDSEEIVYHDSDDAWVAVGAEWAEEQSDCGKKTSYKWSSESECVEMFEPMIKCDKWGGGYIFKTGGKGCIQMSLIVNNPKDRKRTIGQRRGRVLT